MDPFKEFGGLGRRTKRVTRQGLHHACSTTSCRRK
jgi:hypothetical protein